jgi:oligoribonuclease NrnB/cAMP/cGMP phosphodiesterase (DHH superfamily)
MEVRFVCAITAVNPIPTHAHYYVVIFNMIIGKEKDLGEQEMYDMDDMDEDWLLRYNGECQALGTDLSLNEDQFEYIVYEIQKNKQLVGT